MMKRLKLGRTAALFALAVLALLATFSVQVQAQAPAVDPGVALDRATHSFQR